MDAYTDMQALVVRRIQDGYRAELAADRLAARATPRRVPAPGAALPVKAARLLVAIVLVAVGVGGLAGAGTLLAGPTPADGPTPDLAN